MIERLAPDVNKYLEKERTIREEGKPIPEKMFIPRIEDVPEGLLFIAENIANISGTWNPVEIFTADSDSIKLEKTKFIEHFDNGESYNPVFTYSYAQSLDMSEARSQLMAQLDQLRDYGKQTNDGKIKRGGRQTLPRIERLFRAALYFKIRDDLATCDLVEGIKEKDEDKIARAFKRKYPGTDQAILESATSVYNNILSGKRDEVNTESTNGYPLSEDEQEFLKSKVFSDKEIAQIFEWGLDQYDILYSDENPDGYKVVISKDVTGIDVRDKSSIGAAVFIPEGREDTADKVLELLGHEIEGHARQSKNGEKTFVVGGGRLKVDNEMLYEGLGKRYDDRYRKKFFGTSSGEPLPYYTFAIASAENGSSFYDVFSQQVDLRLRARLRLSLEAALPDRQYIDPKVLDSVKNASWTTAYRVMRGHLDTSNKGKYAMAKDLSYLRGWLIDKQLENNGLGFLNEEGVIASGGLQLLAELRLGEDQLPIPYKDLASKYWEEVLKPQMKEK